MFEIGRRQILKGVPLALIGARLYRPGSAVAQALSPGDPLPGTGLVVGRPVPLTAEAPVSGMTTWITPIERFPILTSIASAFPAIDPASWGLSVGGQVERPGSITYDQLRGFPAHTAVALIECAGNSRNTVSPPLPPSFLNNGYIGNAEWRGVPLRLILDQFGLKAGAREIVLEGADRGKPPFAPTEVPFAKSIPVDKALHPDTLLVYEMNGVPLPRQYGGPVRMLVPGWYGTYHVKWIRHIEAIDQTFDGVFMTKNWRVRRRRDGFLREEAVSQVAVKSLIVRPSEGEKLTLGEHRIQGVAWSGGKDITSVHVTTDGGVRWRPARLLEPHATYAWRLWEFPWRVPSSGTYTLMARAADTSGAVQPFAYDLDLNGFEVNHVQPVRVQVG